MKMFRFNQIELTDPDSRRSGSRSFLDQSIDHSTNLQITTGFHGKTAEPIRVPTERMDDSQRRIDITGAQKRVRRFFVRIAFQVHQRGIGVAMPRSQLISVFATQFLQKIIIIYS